MTIKCNQILQKSSAGELREEELENEAKNEENEEEDYSKLLKDLDEEDDEDIVAKVLKRYGLKFVFRNIWKN